MFEVLNKHLQNAFERENIQFEYIDDYTINVGGKIYKLDAFPKFMYQIYDSDTFLIAQADNKRELVDTFVEYIKQQQ